GVGPRVARAAILVPTGEVVAGGAVEALRALGGLSPPGIGALTGAHARGLHHRRPTAGPRRSRRPRGRRLRARSPRHRPASRCSPRGFDRGRRRLPTTTGG